MKSFLLAAATVLLCASGGFIPVSVADSTWVLQVDWPHIGRKGYPASNRVACLAGADAALAGNMEEVEVGDLIEPASPRHTRALSAQCLPGNLFPAGWDCIHGFNCGNRSLLR